MDVNLESESESETAIDESVLNALTMQQDEEAENCELKEQEPQIPTAELISPIINLTVNAICPAWNLQKEEIEALSESYADLLDKYFPDAANSFGVELNALLITAAIFTPRIGKPRFEEPIKPKKEDEKEEKTTRPGQFEGFPDERIEGE